MDVQSYQQQDANKPSGESGQGNVASQYRRTCLGQIRKFQSLDKCEVVFIFVSSVFIVVIASLSIYKMTIVGRRDTDFTFSLFVLCNMVFCVYYVIHGVLGERPYEILLFLMAVFAVIFYSGLNYGIAYDDRGPFKLARLITVGVMFLLLLCFCIKHIIKYLNCRRLMYTEIVNANLELQDACKTLFVFHDWLKLDLQLGIGIVILILNSTDGIKLDDYIVLPVGLVFSIIWFVIGFVGSRKESSKCMLFFYITSSLEPAYILYKIAMSAEQVGLNLKGASIVCGCVGLVTRIIVLNISCKVKKNFGKGLKDYGFCVYYVIIGVLGERPYEIVLFLTSIVLSVLYSGLNYGIAYDDRGPYKLARIVIVSLTFLILLPFCIKYIQIYRNSRESEFSEKDDEILELQDACKILFIFCELLKLDGQLGIGIVILILNSTDGIKLDDCIVLSVGGVFSIIWFIIGFVGSCKESSNCMLFFYITSPLEPAYILYKIIMSIKQVGLNLKGVSILCGCLALVTRIIVLIISCKVKKNFGKGLKDYDYDSNVLKGGGEGMKLRGLRYLGKNSK